MQKAIEWFRWMFEGIFAARFLFVIFHIHFVFTFNDQIKQFENVKATELKLKHG